MRTEGAAKPSGIGPRKTRKEHGRRGASFRVFRGFLPACGGLLIAGAAHAQPAPPLINEPAVVAPGFTATLLVVNLPPAGSGPLTTAGQAGHRHPASTYAYVTKGAVINRLGDEAEKRFEVGQAWSETPLQPHYIVNASRTEPAQIVVVQISKTGTTRLTEPLPK